MLNSTLKQNTPLRSYTPLRAKTGFKRSTYQMRSLTPLNRQSRLKKRSDSPMIELDGIFSEVIRRKHADYRGMVSCVTCWKMFHWKVIQAGHFIDRQYLLTRYDETNVFPQCSDDNCFMDKKEMLAKYSAFLVLQFGSEYPGFLKEKAKGDGHGFPFKSLIAKYTEERDRLRILQDKEIKY